jgi:DNA polymerase-1
LSGALDQVQLHLVDNMDELVEFKNWVGEIHPSNVLGFDTETTGLSPYTGDFVRLIQIGDTFSGWAFPPGWHGAALQILKEWDGDWVAHNSRFDINFLRRNFPTHYDPDWTRIHDTMTMAHLDDPTRSRGLKPLSGMLIDPRAASSQVVLDKEMNLNDWNWATVPITREGAASSYWIYAALDPVLTCRLYEHFAPVRSTYKTAYELEMGTVRCIADMERRGARVDLEYCDAMIEKINAYSAQVRAWVKTEHGVDNATSMAQCIRRFEELGRTITRTTKSGAKSLDKEQLEMLIAEGDLPGTDLAEALLALRKGEKQVGPYFSNFHNMVDEASRVHPTIWPVGTRTARMSIQNPALQTLPRKDPTVRTAFIPSDGNVLITCDYDQIEMRLAAHFSQDEGLRQAFMGEGDFFTTVASEAFGEPVTKADPRRQLIKNGLYGKLYGAGVPKIAVTAGVPIHQMEIVMASFDSRYPGITMLQKQIEAVARQRGEVDGRPFVQTPTGRKMPGDKGKEYTLVNYLIQSHAAEVLKRAICDLDAAGLGEYMLLPVHDELVFDVPKDVAEDAAREIPRIMGDDSYFVPLTAGLDMMATNWGDKYRKGN